MPDITFTDYLHLERLRSCLWKGRYHGRASVMVGAGFSLNASRKSPGVRKFPTWTNLSSVFVDQLHPAGTSSASDRDSAFKNAITVSGALRLAEEYEAAFGRDALDTLIIEQIPDTDFEPCHLHKLLLTLPWAEVLTTNYDTLLERAALEVAERKYRVVRTMAEISSSARPRIVKLHGSFPSIRPFILTEEDFRTYPRRFAPFVNLAQQAIMETTLVLLGFSGDDPNFLAWSGWVRDNLGATCPQIYLCGVLELTAPRRLMLQSRNVVPIDLAPLFPISKFPIDRHSRAIEWLLLTLEAGKPPITVHWPYYGAPELTSPSPGLPAIPVPTHKLPLTEPI